MKKKYLVWFPMLVIFVGAFLTISPHKTLSQEKMVRPGTSIPDNVIMILRKSCLSCHSSGGNVMAQSVWSFISWDNYSKNSQARKSESMCFALTNQIMPPTSVRQINPSRTPTAAENEIICRWANSLKKQ